MRKIKTSRRFDKDLQKFGLSAPLIDVLGHLLHGSRLPEKYRNHALTGNWQDYRDCHIKPDQVLIYRIHGDTIELHRMGTHAELFG